MNTWCKMNVSNILKRAGKFTSDNSPAILTAIGIAGTITTAILSYRAGMKVSEDLQIDMDERIHEAGSINRVEPLTTKEKLRLTWRAYIPPVGVGCLTVGCILFAAGIGHRRAAGMAAAFAISEKAFIEYKDKVIEKIGENKERGIRDELAQDRVNRKPLNDVIVVGDGTVLCFESFTGRYFLSDLETLKKAQNDTNYQVLNDYYASLTDFYNRVGLDRTSNSDEVGWNSDRLLELLFSATITEGGKPCIVMDFHVTPIRDFYRIN